ncbi:pyruvate dehydrogenase E1 component subunit alpha, mitochondrial-like isoform X2 [Lucilia sericata]|uniref:pyruvate dehydrogenase E1 component subunit alpha, mitochondrial-like isoform X2 n=1 Tax=Lucilia sericata TaxID=13632 RepID=UPI0018A81FA1|nr:pyruvate dehydrogenase E1 component subunit alpha, mitochondrial-like isoform X2 [Lucilia sericata]
MWSFKLYNLEKEPCSSICLSQQLALKLYQEMQTIRRMENACGNLYKEKLIRGFCHLYVGQEACCVGIKSSMRSQDTIITSYRSHGWTWLMGVSIYNIIAELCQKQTGCSRGKGGSMHTYAPNFFGGNGIVGAQTPLGAGIAFAHAYNCDGGVNFACYGDGAANQGQLHEVFNIACLWKLPVVFVCENNKYGMGTSMKRSSCSTDYYTRGDYIPGLWVNGNDVLAVRSAAEFVINHARSCGPIVMELETYRYHGHSMSDPGTSYRKREEVQIMREKYDPITTFRDLCLKHKLIKEEEFKKIDDTIKTEIDEIVKQVRLEKETDPAELATDVYAQNLEGKIRNIIWRDLKHTNVGIRLIPPGTVKATPKSEIKELPKPEAKTEAKPLTEADKKKDDLKEQQKKGEVKNDEAKNAKQAKEQTKDLAKKPAPAAKPKTEAKDKDKKPKDPKKK